MKTIHFLIVLFAPNLSVTAQDYCSTSLINKSIDRNKSAIITADLYVNLHPSKKEQFYNNWADGYILFTNGTKSVNCKLRYNAWLDELIWLREKDFKSGVVLKSTIKEFTLITKNNTEVRFGKFEVSNGLSTSKAFLEILSEGNYSLLCHRKAVFNKASDNFSLKHQFYLCLNGKITKTALNKRSLAKVLSNKEFEKLKQILKEDKLSIKNEHELAKAFSVLGEE